MTMTMPQTLAHRLSELSTIAFEHAGRQPNVLAAVHVGADDVAEILRLRAAAGLPGMERVFGDPGYDHARRLTDLLGIHASFEDQQRLAIFERIEHDLLELAIAGHPLLVHPDGRFRGSEIELRDDALGIAIAGLVAHLPDMLQAAFADLDCYRLPGDVPGVVCPAILDADKKLVDWRNGREFRGSRPRRWYTADLVRATTTIWRKRQLEKEADRRALIISRGGRG